MLGKSSQYFQFREKNATYKKLYTYIYVRQDMHETVPNMKTIDKAEFLRESSETLRAIAHPLRLAIIELLHDNNRLSVTEIHETLDIEQAVASHHLRILKSKKVVDLDRDGKNSLYYLVQNDFFDIFKILEKVH